MPEDYSPYEGREEHDMVNKVTAELARIMLAIKTQRRELTRTLRSVKGLMKAIDVFAERKKTTRRKDDEKNTD